MQQIGKRGLHRGRSAQVDLGKPREIPILFPLQDPDRDSGLVLEVVVERADTHAGELTDLLDGRDRIATFSERASGRVDQACAGLLRLSTAIAHSVDPNPNSDS